MTKMSRILKRLLFLRDMRPAHLARAINVPSPTIHRYLTGKSQAPYLSSIKPIAEFFEITPDQLLGNKPLPEHFLFFEENSLLINGMPLHQLPLYSWETVADEQPKLQGENTKVAYLGEISEDAFATTLPTTSMEPAFAKGATLIFCTEKTATDRSFVLVHLAESAHIVFRQLIIDLNKRYLKPLNPDLINTPLHCLSNSDKILGVLQEARQNFSD